MQSFIKYLISLDDYGKAVNVSYKGDSTYKTKVGAFLTIAMRSFMLAFIVTGVMDLVKYKNPQITQYVIYDDRSDDSEVTLGESYGDIIWLFR